MAAGNGGRYVIYLGSCGFGGWCGCADWRPVPDQHGVVLPHDVGQEESAVTGVIYPDSWGSVIVSRNTERLAGKRHDALEGVASRYYRVIIATKRQRSRCMASNRYP